MAWLPWWLEKLYSLHVYSLYKSFLIGCVWRITKTTTSFDFIHKFHQRLTFTIVKNGLKYWITTSNIFPLHASKITQLLLNLRVNGRNVSEIQQKAFRRGNFPYETGISTLIHPNVKLQCFYCIKGKDAFHV